MRLVLLSILFVQLVFFTSCKDDGGNLEVHLPPLDTQQFYLSKIDEVPDFMKDSVGSWVKVGAEGYGIMAIVSSVDSSFIGLPLPCKVVSFHENGIKLQVTQTTYPYSKAGCTKMGLRKGETWIESTSTLFQTEAEAIDALRKKNAYIYDFVSRSY